MSLLATRTIQPGACRPALRPRVIQVIPSLRTGGLENVVLRLVQRLHPDVPQAVMTPACSGPLASRFPEGVSVIAMADRHRPDYWNAIRMARVFRQLRPDVVHTRNWSGLDAVVGARIAGVPYVIHGEHGREAGDPAGANPKRRRIRRMLAPLVTEFVTVSKDLARWLVEEVQLPARRVRTICNGVDTDRFAPGDRDAARGALGIPAGFAAIGTVGRLDLVKDQAGLIRAFAVVARRHPALLFVAGEGPQRGALESVSRELGLADSVRLLGERQDIPQLLRALDLFALPSLGEGMSNAILEAMATGLPVVATRVGGNGELVMDGVTGRLVDVGQPDALGEVLGEYLLDPGRARRHGAAGRERAAREFGFTSMLEAYRNLYRPYLGVIA
jgi:sugar transferase (PEP-CTERM/EpsH1 system associated)